MKKLVNGELVDLTADEIAARQAEDDAYASEVPTTDEEKITGWLASNPFADALIRALNKPTSDPNHLPPNAALPQADLVAKIKANLP